MKVGKLVVNMKTIRNTNTGQIVRVENKEAELKVGYGWEFISKSIWKEQIRGKYQEQKKSKPTQEVEISDNLSDKNVRKARKEEKRQKYANKL
jgi:hypothetical protein